MSSSSTRSTAAIPQSSIPPSTIHWKAIKKEGKEVTSEHWHLFVAASLAIAMKLDSQIVPPTRQHAQRKTSKASRVVEKSKVQFLTTRFN